MADQTGLGSTGMDLTKVNPYGATDEQLKEIQDALKQNITSLQNRYAQPNWFKVAAGFAKPQLGGFLASLGSASEALGENVEKQREIEIPVAQMRSQLAQSNLMLSKRKEVSDDIAKWKTDHKGQLPPPDLIAEWAARSPDLPAVQAMADQQNRAREQQELQIRSQENALRAAQLNRELGITVPGAGSIESPSTVTGGPSGNVPPTGDSLTAVVGKSNTGARLNAEQQALQNLGIPIISGVRTPEEQAGLRDHQDANENWVTKQGLPVARQSQHISGNAIDVDSSKLTSQQKQILEALGYSQPLPNDPNHWQKSAGSSAEEGLSKKVVLPTSVSDSPLLNPVALQSGAQAKTNEQREKIYSSLYEDSVSATSPETQSTLKSNIDIIKNILTNPQTRAIADQTVNPIGRQTGVIGALAKAIDTGIGINIQNIFGQIKLPVNDAMLASQTEEQKKIFSALNLANSNINSIVQTQRSINPNAVSNMELGSVKITATDPRVNFTDTMLYAALQLDLSNDMRTEVHQVVEDLLNNRDPKYQINPNSQTRLADAYNSPRVKEITDKYSNEFKALNRSFVKGVSSRKK